LLTEASLLFFGVFHAAPTPLPPVAAGSTLAHIAVGRGTQNYTCADSTAQSKPVAIGAVARLYNVTCLAATAPETLAYMAASALEYDLPRREDARLAPLKAPSSGRHYFVGGTPLFEVGTKKETYGSISCKKDASSPAPADAPKGRGGKGFGSVPWLKLTDSGGSTGFKEVYRLYTAGGNPPPTCEGQAKTFEIEYATLYVLFNRRLTPLSFSLPSLPSCFPFFHSYPSRIYRHSTFFSFLSFVLTDGFAA
jgi:hypothetical protein